MGGVRRKKSRRNTTINILRKKRKAIKPYIGNKVMEKYWDSKKTLQQNTRALGLAYDANSTIPIVKKKRKRRKDLHCSDENKEMEIEKEEVNLLLPFTPVITEFEKQAANGKKFERHISPDEAKFLLNLMKSHKTDYSKMCKDKRNMNQHTANQLRRKCEGLLGSSLLPKYKEMFPELTIDEMEI